MVRGIQDSAYLPPQLPKIALGFQHRALIIILKVLQKCNLNRINPLLCIESKLKMHVCECNVLLITTFYLKQKYLLLNHFITFVSS